MGYLQKLVKPEKNCSEFPTQPFFENYNKKLYKIWTLVVKLFPVSSTSMEP